MPHRTFLDRIRPIAAWFRSSEMLAGLILALFIGVLAGLGAVLFRWLITGFQSFFIDRIGSQSGYSRRGIHNIR